MKKRVLVLLSILIFGLSLQANAAEVLNYGFDNENELTTVTNTLKAGGEVKFGDGVKGKALLLNGSYGLKLGEVGNTFTVSAMVKMQSTGGTNTIFFKDMDNVGNKWTGVLSNNKKPAFWTHGANHRWETVATGDANLSQWSHVTYVEKNAVGSLYVNGELVGSGDVENGSGVLYLGVTYWSADAVSALIDEVTLFDNALSEDEVMAEYEKHVDFKEAVKPPKEVIGDITLVEKIATKTVVWETSDKGIIGVDGKVVRQEEDKTVTLKAFIDGEVIGEFEVTVLKKPVKVNENVILSYVFDENDGEIIHDVSGNGNHGAAFNGVVIGENGAVFDGVDDYVKMPDGVLSDASELTITTTFKPLAAQKHVFLYGFGNSTEKGYIFLNPSRPDTNTLRFAATKTNAINEKDIKSLPGIRNGEEVTVTVVISGMYASMYVDGYLVMEGNIGMEVNCLGETKENYIAKSLYAADPYFAGEMKEFTVYNYAMSEAQVGEKYRKAVEYAPEKEKEEYITDVKFGEEILVNLDTYGRNDVRVCAVVLDENGETIEVKLFGENEKIKLENEGKVIVFAFNEEENVPGNIYVKGEDDCFRYEYVPGVVNVSSSEEMTGGMLIVAGFDTEGVLSGVAVKVCDIKLGEEVSIADRKSVV